MTGRSTSPCAQTRRALRRRPQEEGIRSGPHEGRAAASSICRRCPGGSGATHLGQNIRRLNESPAPWRMISARARSVASPSTAISADRSSSVLAESAAFSRRHAPPWRFAASPRDQDRQSMTAARFVMRRGESPIASCRALPTISTFLQDPILALALPEPPPAMPARPASARRRTSRGRQPTIVCGTSRRFSKCSVVRSVNTS